MVFPAALCSMRENPAARERLLAILPLIFGALAQMISKAVMLPGPYSVCLVPALAAGGRRFLLDR